MAAILIGWGTGVLVKPGVKVDIVVEASVFAACGVSGNGISVLVGAATPVVQAETSRKQLTKTNKAFFIDKLLLN